MRSNTSDPHTYFTPIRFYPCTHVRMHHFSSVVALISHFQVLSEKSDRALVTHSKLSCYPQHFPFAMPEFSNARIAGQYSDVPCPSKGPTEGLQWERLITQTVGVSSFPPCTRMSTMFGFTHICMQACVSGTAEPTMAAGLPVSQPI